MSFNRKASKKHCEITEVKNVEKVRFDQFVDCSCNRLLARLAKGRKVKPCGRGCWDYGFVIAKSYNHGSFANFPNLMDDKEFLIEAAKVTPKPTTIDNYFYMYINPYLKKDYKFKLEFLKAVYLNEQVYEWSVIKDVVEFCDLQHENEMLLKDQKFKNEIEAKLVNMCYRNCDAKASSKSELMMVLDKFESTVPQSYEERLDDLRKAIPTEFFV